MRSLFLLFVVVSGLSTGAAFAAEGNHFAKGMKSYQRSTPVERAVQDEQASGIQEQASQNTENPQDIAPAAGDEIQDQSLRSEEMMDSIQLPRK